jgi:mono/diheme cytochrome c family protein
MRVSVIFAMLGLFAVVISAQAHDESHRLEQPPSGAQTHDESHGAEQPSSGAQTHDESHGAEQPSSGAQAHDESHGAEHPSSDTHSHEEAHRAEQLLPGAQALAARDAYLANCAGCHGEDGSGDSAGNDFGSPEAVASLTRQAMIETALHGHPDTTGADQIPELGTQQISEIVDYIRDALMLPAPLADASVGRSIYARTCSVCHGERGDSASWVKNSLNPAPFDFTSDRAKRELNRQRMIRSVRYGVRETAMMPFATQLSREEIAAVVDYIRANFVKPDEVAAADEQTAMAGHGAANHSQGGGHGHDHAAASADFDPDAAFPDDLIGNYAAGEIFYENNCAECHGLDGDGDGRRAYFMRRKPQDFTSPKARAELNRPHLFAAVSNGTTQTDMSAWSKVLDAQQIADVAEYVFRAFIHPTAAEPADAITVPTWQPPREAKGAKKKP